VAIGVLVLTLLYTLLFFSNRKMQEIGPEEKFISCALYYVTLVLPLLMRTSHLVLILLEMYAAFYLLS
jgi:hypothetical protein